MEWKLSSLHKAKYGRYDDTRPFADRCCVVVQSSDNWVRSHQCKRKRGYGPEQAYCKQHDPDAVKAREEAWRKTDNAKWAARRIEWAGPKFLAVLRQIAEGHNDPRSLAQEAIAEFPKATP